MRYLLFLMLSCLPSQSFADKPQRPALSTVISEDSSIIVRVTPTKTSIKDSLVNPKKVFATASFFKWNDNDGYSIYQRIQLRNPVAPLYYFVSNEGALVTLDNWYHGGSGEIIVIYSPQGNIIKEYELSDLFPIVKEREKLDHSHYSIFWRCIFETPELLGNQLFVPIASSGSFRIDLHSGAVDRVEMNRKCDE